ncbi:MAG: hypothetical protein NZ921_05230 [Candidatus Caldarchaeum sp.]|nr:hypothetical protein [Candidatus Caldarchaeum sp.]
MERCNPWWAKEQDPKYANWVALPKKWIADEIDRILLTPFSLNFVYALGSVNSWR